MAKGVGTSEADLVLLDAELRRLTRRADLRRRRMKQSTQAWQLWSSTIDEGLDIVRRIDDARAGDLAGLATKFRAILWRIRVDEDVIMDEAVRRALHRFGRQLVHMASDHRQDLTSVPQKPRLHR